jgi:hypothetical protein
VVLSEYKIIASMWQELRAGKVQSVYQLTMGWMVGIRIPAGAEVFLFDAASRLALGPTQPPIQWVQGAVSLWVKRAGRETDHSPQSSAEVKECVKLYLHSLNTLSWRGAQLKETHRDNFTFMRQELGIPACCA